MTQDEIIKMAIGIGLEYRQNNNEINTPYCDGIHIDELRLFAELVAQHEREKSLKLWMLLDDIDTADDIAKTDHDTYRRLCRNTQQKRWDVLSESEVDDAIRARGQA